MGENINTKKVFIFVFNGRRAHAGPRCRWKHIIGMDRKEIMQLGCVLDSSALRHGSMVSVPNTYEKFRIQYSAGKPQVAENLFNS
jgi:hypothetical protein